VQELINFASQSGDGAPVQAAEPPGTDDSFTGFSADGTQQEEVIDLRSDDEDDGQDLPNSTYVALVRSSVDAILTYGYYLQ